MNVLITGGSTGVGKAIVKKLATDKHNKIFYTYCHNSAFQEFVNDGLKNINEIKCDFINEDSIIGLEEMIPGMDLDVLINNAYCGMEKKHFHKIEPHVFLHSFKTNVYPVIKITQQAIKVFRKKKFGKIINIITSAVVSKPPIGWAEYVANKSYILSMSKSWAIENASFNITSNSISPAFVETKFTSDFDERIIEEMRNKHPLKKLLTAEEVAETVLFLVNGSQQINGTNIIINAASDVI